MNDLTLSDIGDVQRVIDPNNRDVLVGRRLEIFFDPAEDFSVSFAGKLIWHTEWWHMTGSVIRGKSIGPKVERTIEQLMAGDFGGIPGVQVIAAVKAAYVQHMLEGNVAPTPTPAEPEQ